jgi:hypothetical protein
VTHRTVKTLGVFVYSQIGTEYDWTSRALGDEFSTVSETMEEDVLEFVHSDITIKLDDSDGVVSGLLMALDATSKWKCEVWRDPASWVLLWGGTIDATTIAMDYADKTVSFTAYSHSKLLDLTSAESVQRTVTGVTGNAQVDLYTLTVTDGTNLYVDDEIQLAEGAVKEKRRLASKNGNSFTVTEPWSSSFAAAPLTLLTPYYRDQAPDYLATQLFTKAGISPVNTRLDSLSVSDPYPGRMNSNGLSRRTVECVTRRGSNIAVFESDASFYATNPSAGFLAGSYTPTQPTDWTAYVGTEPGSFKDLEAPDDGRRVCGNQTTYYWYLITKLLDTNPPTCSRQLWIKRSDGTETLVATVPYNTNLFDGIPWFDSSIEYNPTDAKVWVSYKGYQPDGNVYNQGCIAYNTGATLSSAGSRPALGGSKLRFSYIGPHIVEFGTDYVNIRNAATPYATTSVLEHRPNLVAWTFRRISFDSTTYWCCLQRRAAQEFGKFEWYLILWSYTTGSVITETKIAVGYALTRCNGSVWYDAGGTDDVYIGYVELEEVGGMYFYLTKAASVIEYADFKGKSCADALKALARSTGSIIWVSRDQRGYFIGRNSLAVEFSKAPVAISNPFRKVKRRFWEWYRTSCKVTGSAPVTGDEFSELAGDTGNTQFRLEVDAEYVSTPGMAQALAQSYVNFLSNTQSALEVVVAEPTLGPAVLFNTVTLDGVTYRVFKTENEYATGEQALTLVQE